MPEQYTNYHVDGTSESGTNGASEFERRTHDKAPVSQWLRALHERGPRGVKVRGIVHALACHHNYLRQDAFPSQKTLADMAGMEVKDARACLNELDSAGWIRRERRGRKSGGQGWLYLYSLAIPVRQKEEVIPQLSLVVSNDPAPLDEEWCECQKADCHRCTPPF